MERAMGAKEYFAHRYAVPKIVPALPLADEDYLVLWGGDEAAMDIPAWLEARFGIASVVPWKSAEKICLTFTKTLAERLTFYTQQVLEEDCAKIYLRVNQKLEELELLIREAQRAHEDEYGLLCRFASIDLDENI